MRGRETREHYRHKIRFDLTHASGLLSCRRRKCSCCRGSFGCVKPEASLPASKLSILIKETPMVNVPGSPGKAPGGGQPTTLMFQPKTLDWQQAGAKIVADFKAW